MNVSRPVPVTLLNVIVALLAAWVDEEAAHTSFVSVNQDEVLQIAPENVVLVLRSMRPKLSPAKVINAPPVFGEFKADDDITGASNDSTGADVPTDSARVITASRELWKDEAHSRRVALAHDKVSHVPDDI